MKYLGLVLIFLISCSTFSYHYYGIAPPEGKSLEGTLLGPKPKDDLPLSKCDPDAQDKGKCVVLFREEWELLQRDMVDLKKRLEACESGH